jgi:16S rRNA A1518/A1519 N6-dimethyltransferase RsmA/KsgA/DIM1 with predicted DNA glycosylase/AP lyase activity
MWFWLFAVVVLCFGLGALLGAPFLPVRKVDAEAALDLAELKAGQTLIDLGSGDGRLLLAAAQRGASAIGYEVNPIMYLWSLVVTWRYRRQISVRLQNFWRLPLPPADVIYIFLGQEVARPTKVVSYVFELPRQPIKSTRNTHLYLYP